jgi:hypothetical protein
MKYRKIISKTLLLLLTGIFLATAAHARPRTSVKNTVVREENQKGYKSTLILPYAFSTDSMGTTIGVGGALKGYGQKQLLLGATAFGSFDGAVGGFLGMWDYRPSWAQRLFFSAQGMVGHYPNQRAYSAPAFPPDVIRPGSNDSGEDQYIEKSGYDNWSDFKLEYVLPIGTARGPGRMDYSTTG